MNGAVVRNGVSKTGEPTFFLYDSWGTYRVNGVYIRLQASMSTLLLYRNRMQNPLHCLLFVELSS